MTFEKTIPSSPGRVFSRQRAPLGIAIVLTTSLVAFEGLSISIALPEIGLDLGATENLPWIVTAYLLASALAMALAGSVIDRLGPRRVFRAATVAFTAFSALCTVAPSVELLTLARALQGFSGGTIVATSGAAIGLGYPRALRSRVYALSASVWGVLAVTGPAIAAALLLWSGWRAIFGVNVPLALIACALGWRAMPGKAMAGKATVEDSAATSAAPASRLTLDGRGALLVAGLLVTGLMGLSSPTLEAWAWLLAAAAFAGLYWHHSGRAAAPMLERRFFARAPFRDLALTSGLIMAAGMGVETYLPLYLRGGRGASTTLAAWSVLFLAAGWTVSANVASRLYHRLPETRVARLGPLAMIPIMALAGAAVWFQAPLPVLFALYFAMGLGIGMTTNACLTLVQQRAADQEIGRATAAHQFLRNLSVTYGTAGAGAIVITWATSGSHPSAVESPHAGEQLAGLSIDGLGTGFALAHGAAVLLALGAVLAARRLAHQDTSAAPHQPLPEPANATSP